MTHWIEEAPAALRNITISGFQVRPEYLTAVCGTCGALLGDIDKHDQSHEPTDLESR